MAQDRDGRIWVAIVSGFDPPVPDGIGRIDAESVTLEQSISRGGGTVKGIAVDADGYVWAVNQVAHKIDPVACAHRR